MAQVAIRRRLVNPRRKRRKLSPKQIRFFGTKAQRAALKRRRKRNTSTPKRRRNYGSAIRKATVGKLPNPARRRRRRTAKRKSNVGEVITIGLQGVSNSGSKRRNPGVAKRRKRRTTATRRRRTYRRRRNPGLSAAPRRRRRRNYGVARRGRRRNPGMLTGRAGQVIGIIGGASLTGLIQNTFVPAQLNQGFVGYLSTAAVAMLQGTLAGKFLKNSSLGTNMTLGGFVYLGLRVINDMVPSLAAQSPIGLRGRRRGMGLIAGQSGFPTPRVFAQNSMTQDYMRPVPASMSGLGRRGLTLARRVA